MTLEMVESRSATPTAVKVMELPNCKTRGVEAVVEVMVGARLVTATVAAVAVLNEPLLSTVRAKKRLVPAAKPVVLTARV